MMTTRRMLPPAALVLALAFPACGDEAPDTTLRTYEADDPNLQYTGRIDWMNPKQPRFSLGATYLTARFRGTGVIRVRSRKSGGTFASTWMSVVTAVGSLAHPIAASEQAAKTTRAPRRTLSFMGPA